MFEKFFGPKEITPEEAENIVSKVIQKQMYLRVNAPNIRNAFRDAKELNEQKNLGLTNNHLLNLTRAAALANYGPAETFLYGEGNLTHISETIDAEIENLREGLTSEERRS